jgi:HlyD family secretion protein
VAQVKNLEASLLNSRAEISISKANINKAKVTLEESERNYKRVEELFKRKLVSASDRDTAKTTLDSAKASYEVSLAQLESSKAKELSTRAQIDAANAQIEGAQARVRQMEAQLKVSQINLDRTSISSPIDGVVISREVDEGQTVAASLQAPKLFVIAQDLRKMQIDTAVDEADIGQVHDGQTVTFTVDAYKDKVFKGKIHQVRLMPIETSNVVTYSVMVNVENDELLLKPGMTANVEIIVGNKKDVLRIPSKSLYFKAPEELKAQLSDGQTATDTIPIWVLENGKPSVKSVKIGISNDRFIEVLSGDLAEGQTIIIGQGAAGSSKNGKDSSGGVSARDVRRATRRM